MTIELDQVSLHLWDQFQKVLLGYFAAREQPIDPVGVADSCASQKLAFIFGQSVEDPRPRCLADRARPVDPQFRSEILPWQAYRPDVKFLGEPNKDLHYDRMRMHV